MTDFLATLKSEPFVLRHEQTLQFVERMCRDFPEAAFHRRVLQELGCDFSYAGKNRETGCWYSVMELGGSLQRMLGVTSGIQVSYTPFQDLQPRTIDSMRKQNIDRKRSESIYLLHTPDMFAQRKVDNWTFRDTYSVLTLPPTGDPKTIARQLLGRILEASSRNNPYERTTPVYGAEFFGRNETLRSLVNEIRSGHVCGLFGLRKTGKTSLLSELGRLFELGDPENSIFILQDLEVLPSDPKEKVPQLLSDISKQLQIAFKQQGVRTHELANLSRQSSVGDLRQAIEASLRRGPGLQKMVVIALDEVESLVGADALSSGDSAGIPELFGALRALVQENKNFNVVLSGITTAPIMYPTLYGRENPLFAWAKPTFVAEITRSESSKMLLELGSRMAAHWTPPALETIYDFTGGQVFLTRSLAGFVASTLSNDISDRVIDEARVRDGFRQWRRTAVLLVDGMIDSLNRFYPNEVSLVQLGTEAGQFEELESEFAAELTNLVNLGVLIDAHDGLQLSAWTQLGSKWRRKLA